MQFWIFVGVVRVQIALVRCRAMHLHNSIVIRRLMKSSIYVQMKVMYYFFSKLQDNFKLIDSCKSDEIEIYFFGIETHLQKDTVSLKNLTQS